MKAKSHHAPYDRYSVAYPEIGITYLAEVEWTTLRTGRWHSHRELQALWILDGFMSLEIDGRRYEENGGGCYIIPAQVQHIVMQQESPPRVLFLDLRVVAEPACTMAKFLNELQQTHLKIDSARLRSGAHSLRDALAQTTSSRVAHLQAVLWEMIAGLDAGGAHHAAMEPDSGSWKLRAAENLMKDRLAQPLGIDDLATAAGISRSQLTRLYIRHFGVGPAERLRQLRIERACELMTGSTLNVKEVAHVCGFVCANHFCRVFLKTMGATPTEYRLAKLASA
jgi:AraC-like DNA-binding protein